ncbi:hypothetical protein X727_01015 [Mesorhizobium sp. L103C119B0]|nr:hypothetical protein X762_01985 [Mesorhizobium sp. LSHC426A00]ESY17425.1 hypothetical protein X750_23045 [Mesorhizobium sp. LNJC394B00]ESY61254.1 hypothetical protein X744_04175 [Mesorhizobium sp. LNJC372A00]ESZ73714.1 hypothetical protein X727_01015 [Mesorhizobium sp. L103C119B0]ESZ73815.1 hypothetical protein X726_24675 [Mesorhizobium sp. L103C105A0]
MRRAAWAALFILIVSLPAYNQWSGSRIPWTIATDTIGLRLVDDDITAFDEHAGRCA